MDSKAQNLLRKAGKLMSLGKPALALQLYIKIHELDPQDPTIINTIGDLYLRQGEKDEALIWYQELAEIFESNQRLSSAIATYKKILKLSPHNPDLLTHLAQLYERSGQTPQVKTQYREIARQMMDQGNLDQAVELHMNICEVDPTCPENHLELAQILEKAGRGEHAAGEYLEYGELVVQKGDPPAAEAAVSNLLRLCPHDKEFVKRFLQLLHQVGLTEHAMESVVTSSFGQDPDFKVILGEALLQEGKLEQAQRLLLASPPSDSQTYRTAVKLLLELIARNNIEASLDAVDALLDASIRLHEEATLKNGLESILVLDPSNLRSLQTLTTLQLKTNDRQGLEDYLKRQTLLQLQRGELRGARESLNKMVTYSQEHIYLDLLNLVHEASISGSPSDTKQLCDQVIRELERGIPGIEPLSSGTGMALGVSEIEFGLQPTAGAAPDSLGEPLDLGE